MAWILLAVAVANAPALLHLVTANPLYIDANLTSSYTSWLPGLPYVDPNAGYTTQALGHLAALDWLHGHIPWWNPFEGIGAPLAGEMQSGALFPPTLLLALHDGMLFLKMTLEAFTGGTTYLLVRRLGVGRTFSTAAGVAFGLCGTLAWLSHAPIRPLALLPLSLLGVEQALAASVGRRRGGWQLLAGAAALSVLAGFPEMSFIDGAFVVWWALLRTVGPGRPVWPRMVAKVVAGLAAGIALSAPLLVAFAGYVGRAYVGDHGGAGSTASLPSADLAHLLLPYALGPLLGFHSSSPTGGLDLVWSATGFLTVTTVAAALVGVVGRRQRTLRLGLLGWTVAFLLRTYGWSPVVHLMAAVPGVRLTLVDQWSAPSWQLSVVVLAGLGLDDLGRRLTRRRVLVGAAVVTGALAAWTTMAAWHLLDGAVTTGRGHSGNPRLFSVLSLVGALFFLVLLALGGLLAGRPPPSSEGGRTATAPRHERRRRRGRVLMAGVVGIESVLLFGMPYLSAPRPTSLESGSVDWLQAHLATYRFVTLGPIAPDYGSFFGIAQANVNDLPLPATWNTFVESHLDPNAPPATFTGFSSLDPAGPSPAQELLTHLRAYEDVGVRYVVESATGLDAEGQSFPPRTFADWPAGIRLVYRDGFAAIWQLPLPSSLYSLVAPPPAPGDAPTAADCVTGRAGQDQVAVLCARSATLVRRVQYLPGWSATVVGTEGTGTGVPVLPYQGRPAGLFQEVTVPAGYSVVHFTYLPPYEGPAAAVALAALVLIVATLLVGPIRRHRSTATADGTTTSGGGGQEPPPPTGASTNSP